MAKSDTLPKRGSTAASYMLVHNEAWDLKTADSPGAVEDTRRASPDAMAKGAQIQKVSWGL
ncbi:MAG: hypothetical protein Q7S12_00160 [bacterium]|nr:hypothetical protein [bacterium]